MKTLDRQELMQVQGGIAKAIIGGIIGGAIFVISVIYGIIHPNKC